MSELEKVQRGARLLDEREPGWWVGVDPDTLELSSPTDCVIGQVFGNVFSDDPTDNYCQALESLGIGRTTCPSHEWPAMLHGFDTYHDHETLTGMWAQEIEVRAADDSIGREFVTA